MRCCAIRHALARANKALWLERVVNVYDAATAIGTGRFESAELNSLTRSNFETMVEEPNAFGLGERID